MKFFVKKQYFGVENRKRVINFLAGCWRMCILAVCKKVIDTLLISSKKL